MLTFKTKYEQFLYFCFVHIRFSSGSLKKAITQNYFFYFYINIFTHIYNTKSTATRHHLFSLSGTKTKEIEKDKIKQTKTKKQIKQCLKKEVKFENENVRIHGSINFYSDKLIRQTFWFWEENLWSHSVYWCYLKYLRIFIHEGELQDYENRQYYYQYLD